MRTFTYHILQIQIDIPQIVPHFKINIYGRINEKIRRNREPNS